MAKWKVRRLNEMKQNIKLRSSPKTAEWGRIFYQANDVGLLMLK